MSAFIGSLTTAAAALGNVIQPGFNQNYDGLQLPDYRTSKPQTREGCTEYADILWTRSSTLGSGGQDGTTVGSGGILQADCQRWEYNFPPTGVHVRKKITGSVLDANSNPVAGATVQLFNTATGLLVDTQTSASDGTYQAGDPNVVNCFAVGYEAGSSDTAGTTVNTVTGT